MIDQSSTPSTIPTVNTNAVGSVASTKPIKLRLACNNCFSAKVRCDGNKQGCRRCNEKRLSCIFSESRVGKVVGKRRKKPLGATTSQVDSSTWALNQRPVQSMPSPATTHASDETFKRAQSMTAWNSFVTENDYDLTPVDDSINVAQNNDLTTNQSMSFANNVGFTPHNEFPTPTLSPPQSACLDRSASDKRPRSAHTTTTMDSSRLLPPQVRSASRQRSEPPTSEDEETVCIRLLAHLKKYSQSRTRDWQSQTDLLSKANATVRRILRSKKVRSDYICQLLLSGIVTHLADLCEDIGTGKPDDLAITVADAEASSPQNSNDPNIKPLVFEAFKLASAVGDLLKRKPLNGFQTLGRHESHHVLLDQRLRKVLAEL